MRLKIIFTICMMLLFTGCMKTKDLENDIFISSKKRSSNDTYGYHPIDPLPVNIYDTLDKTITNETILKALPDETIRLAIGEVDENGDISFGPAKIGYKNNHYVVVLDYMKFTTNPLFVKYSLVEEIKSIKKSTLISHNGDIDLVVPTYVGIGLRLKANLVVQKEDVDLSGLFSLGIAAQTNKISGTLEVQTLGISGKSVTAMIPMPSEISTTSIQNAIIAIATIKSKIYEKETNINPRVLGVYNNLGGGKQAINDFISLMLKNPELIKIKM